MSKNLLLIAGLAFLLLPFETLVAQSRTYNIFYVDNSYSKTYANFGQAMFGILADKVDSINNGSGSRFSATGFFVANGNRPKFASNYRGAKNIIDGLADNSTTSPNSFGDRSFIIESLLTTDLSGIRQITLHLFLSEASLINDFVQGNTPGMFINFLPKEIQLLTSSPEENIKVIIYYPEELKRLDQQVLQSFIGFPLTHSDFESRIKFEFVPVSG